MDPSKKPPLLRITGLEKRYGGVRALRGASLTLSAPGIVHGLIGENGSGKSTMLGILSGQLQPDAGEIELNGSMVRFADPGDALAQGIAMVSQETSVALDLTVAENIFMGHRMSRTWRGIDWRATYRRAAQLMGLVGLECRPDMVMRSLRPDECQMVEIVRALSLNSRLLILDEPTSSLTDDEVEALFTATRRISAQGVSTIFVSHKLEELREVSDELTVLRDGRTVAEGDTASFTPDSIISAMVGGAVRARALRTPARARAFSALALELEGLTLGGAFTDVTLHAGHGEVVGLCGLVGAGRSELLASIFGIVSPTAGEIRVDGEPHAPRSPADAMRRGLGYVPANRKTEGLVLTMSTSDNLTMVSGRERPRLLPPARAAERTEVQRISRSVKLNAQSPYAPVQTLSGGNQQKVVLGKWLAAKPKILLLDEPTRGVDVNAKLEIHELLREAATAGTTLLVVSSENSELRNLCDRIIVMFRGRVAADLPVDEAYDDVIARHAGGHV